MELSLAVEEKQYMVSIEYHHSLITSFRLEIQAKVRQLGRNPGAYARQAIESAREHLAVLLHQLKSEMHKAGVW